MHTKVGYITRSAKFEFYSPKTNTNCLWKSKPGVQSPKQKLTH